MRPLPIFRAMSSASMTREVSAPAIRKRSCTTRKVRNVGDSIAVFFLLDFAGAFVAALAATTSVCVGPSSAWTRV